MGTFEVKPGSPLDHALELRSAGDLEGAIDLLLDAVGASLAEVELVTTLASMLGESGQLDRARQWFRHALKLAPGELPVRIGYGTFLCQTGSFEEARELLEGVRTDVGARVEAAERAGVEAPAGLRSMLRVAELNLANLSLEAGDTATARALAEPWLADEDGWGGAHGVLAEVVERDGLDPGQVAHDGLVSGRVSPYMVCYLLEELVDAPVLDFGLLQGLIALADGCFAFDWTRAAPEIEAALARARQRFGQAVMRGEVDPAAYPTLVGLQSRGEAGGADGGDDDRDDGDELERDGEGEADLEAGLG